ncbi:uncharacterized protein si:ch211-89o9.4 isoform X2 [Danio aesculapii]|uniref:uncharacterized protein si:ch211-89o9.4 isoform X2 n=1 Tax=Danio aesculapii TaxID=1142201 RepID=UPI0024BFD0C0|nr:uncharacterized protein si:ch211-89o9.4 isoform X2 [Danio aesculapii]
MMKNSVQRKRNCSSALTNGNIFAHTPQINTKPVCWSQMSSIFTSAPLLFGTTQHFLYKLAQLEAQLLLNLISNVAGGNNTGYANPFSPLLQPFGIQRSSFLSMHQPTGVFTLNRKNMDYIPQMFSCPSSSITENNTVIADKKISDLLSLIISSQYQSNTTKGTMPPDRPQTEEVEPKQPVMRDIPTENLIKVLASLGLSLEDLEILSHFPDNHLTTEKLPLIIQDIQRHKGTKGLECGHNRWDSTDHVRSSRKSSYAPGKYHDQDQRHSEWKKYVKLSSDGQSCSPNFYRSLSAERYSPSELVHQSFSTQSRTLKRVISGNKTDAFSKRPPHGPAEVTKPSPGSLYPPSQSKCSIRRCFGYRDFNKTRRYTRKGCLSSSQRYATSITSRNDRQQQSSFPDKFETTKFHKAQTSAQSKGVIRVSGIPLDYSENELIKMASPFGHPVNILMATEIDTATCLEWKKALLILPTKSSAQDMVKVYSAIPVHMREQSLELVSQTVDLSSSVSVFHAFVRPLIANGLLTPLDHLLVVCNIPNKPCAATGVLRMIKPFGQVLQTLVLNRDKVDADQHLSNKSSVQMVLEMESASVALSVYEWSQKIPCLYHNHHLSFFRGCDIQNKI